MMLEIKGLNLQGKCLLAGYHMNAQLQHFTTSAKVQYAASYSDGFNFSLYENRKSLGHRGLPKTGRGLYFLFDRMVAT